MWGLVYAAKPLVLWGGLCAFRGALIWHPVLVPMILLGSLALFVIGRDGTEIALLKAANEQRGKTR